MDGSTFKSEQLVHSCGLCSCLSGADLISSAQTPTTQVLPWRRSMASSIWKSLMGCQFCCCCCNATKLKVNLIKYRTKQRKRIAQYRCYEGILWKPLGSCFDTIEDAMDCPFQVRACCEAHCCLCFNVASMRRAIMIEQKLKLEPLDNRLRRLDSYCDVCYWCQDDKQAAALVVNASDNPLGCIAYTCYCVCASCFLNQMNAEIHELLQDAAESSCDARSIIDHQPRRYKNKIVPEKQHLGPLPSSDKELAQEQMMNIRTELSSAEVLQLWAGQSE
eukprot:TRINITY_DN10466_c0_g1_i1.p1 TRINITY_DN10466_c0_g1~~TRINITY_DN10466_c0_g1_i1.p1  ORF type:complete len:276 (+),score=12.15 TRINITY_DN10466_c0_g1_i1:81-908(+)